MKNIKFKIEPQWKESKEAIWDKHFAGLTDASAEDNSGTSSKSVPFLRWTMISVAASFILILGLAGFAYLYQVTIFNQAGAQLSAVLPDGSKVEMNAASQIQYKPYWWKINRGVSLQGEAFFKVKKGSGFTVHTSLGEVRVLGTSFNVYARGTDFQVSCFTGKVQVRFANTQKILLPNMRVSATQGQIRSDGFCNHSGVPDWKMGLFCFEQAPLAKVIQEIERRYDVKVETSYPLNYLYTGSFEMPKTAEEALDILSQTYSIPLRILK